eukprot:scaffold4714_cov185-Ochromonas_danica.AAC.6
MTNGSCCSWKWSWNQLMIVNMRRSRKILWEYFLLCSLGGCYGYVRCTLGPTLGFVTGMAEASEAFSIIYAFDEETWLPIIWCGFFCLAFTIPLLGNRPIWWCWAILALFALSIQLIFIAGSMKQGKLSNFLPLYNQDDISFENCVGVFAYASLLFLGVDDMRTCAHNHSNSVVPWAMMMVMIIAITTALATMISARAYVVNPLKYALHTFPYDVGLNIALSGNIAQRFVTYLSMPSLFGCFLGMVYAGGRQFRAMACSRLLPSILINGNCHTIKLFSSCRGFHHKSVVLPADDVNQAQAAKESDETSRTGQPIQAMFVCCGISYVLLTVGYFTIDNMTLRILRMAGLQSCIEAVGAMGAYCVFATRFSSMERGFRSPFGISGAICVQVFACLIVYGLLNKDISDGDNSMAITEAIFLVLQLLYYVLVVKDRQFFSKEEQNQFMKAYVVNANKKRRISNKSGKSGSRSAIKDLYAMALSLKVATLRSPRSSVKSTFKKEAGSLSGVEERPINSPQSYYGKRKHKVLPAPSSPGVKCQASSIKNNASSEDQQDHLLSVVP